MDHSPPGSSVPGILQEGILEWVAMPFSRGSSWPRDRTHIFCSSWFAGRFFTAELLGKPSYYPYLHFILMRLRPKLSHLSEVTQLGNGIADSAGESLHTVHALEHYPFRFSLWDLCICRDCKSVGFTFNYYATLLLSLDFVDSLVLWIYKSISILFVCFFLICFSGSTYQFSSVQSLSRVWLFATLWTAAHQAPMSITNSQRLLKLISIESVMPSNHLLLCCPLLLPPSIFSSIKVFSNESVLCIRWPKYWSFSFSISPSNEYSGLFSFRMDSLDLLAVQGTLKSLLQHHSSKTSILRCSAFFMVQFSYPYMTTGKTIVLTIQSLLAKWYLCFLVCCIDLS